GNEVLAPIRHPHPRVNPASVIRLLLAGRRARIIIIFGSPNVREGPVAYGLGGIACWVFRCGLRVRLRLRFGLLGLIFVGKFGPRFLERAPVLVVSAAAGAALSCSRIRLAIAGRGSSGRRTQLHDLAFAAVVTVPADGIVVVLDEVAV